MGNPARSAALAIETRCAIDMLRGYEFDTCLIPSLPFITTQLILHDLLRIHNPISLFIPLPILSQQSLDRSHLVRH